MQLSQRRRTLQRTGSTAKASKCFGAVISSPEPPKETVLWCTTVRSGAEERRFWGARLDVLIFRLRSYHVLISYSAECSGPKFHKTRMFLGQAGTFLSFQARRSSAKRSSTSDLTVCTLLYKPAKTWALFADSLAVPRHIGVRFGRKPQWENFCLLPTVLNDIQFSSRSCFRSFERKILRRERLLL